MKTLLFIPPPRQLSLSKLTTLDALLELLCESVSSCVRQGKGVLVPGFPRDLRQAREFEAKVGEPSAVLLLSCSVDTMTARSRGGDPADPPADPASDPRRRAESFCSHSQEVAEHYQRKGLLHTVDAERPPDEVSAQICRSMEASCLF